MFLLRFPACFSLYYPIYPYVFTVLKNFRAKIEPVAKHRFSSYPPLLHGASTMSFILLKENVINILFAYKLKFTPFLKIK